MEPVNTSALYQKLMKDRKNKLEAIIKRYQAKLHNATEEWTNIKTILEDAQAAPKAAKK